MGVTFHPSGKYRAYKKIGGRPFQAYEDSFEKAALKLQTFETLARLHTPPLFRHDNTIIGITLKRDDRPGRQGVIAFRYQCKGFRREIKVGHSFNAAWHTIIATWKAHKRMQLCDSAAYASDIQRAKRQYLQLYSTFDCDPAWHSA